MAQSLAFVLVHVVWSTKGRRPVLGDGVRPGLHAYLATIVRGAKGDCFRVGGVEDHVHLAIRMHPTRSLARIVSEVKTASSAWLTLVRYIAEQEGAPPAAGVSGRDARVLCEVPCGVR